MKNTILNTIDEYLLLFPNEKLRLSKLMDFLDTHDEAEITDWNNFDGHLVASGFVYSRKINKFLVVYHKDMDAFLYPGGHIMEADESPMDAAKREIFEETGIKKLEEFKTIPIDIDTHEINYNERLDLPSHYHYDFRYLFIVDDAPDIKIDEDELSEYKWIDINELSNDPNYGSIATKIQKVLSESKDASMKLEWNLDDLFESDDAFYSEIEKIDGDLSDIKCFESVELDENPLLEMLDRKWMIKESANNVLVYGSLKYYKNIKSEECIKLKSDAEALNSKVNLELNFIDIRVLSLGRKRINELLTKNPKLKVYELSLDNLFRMQEHVCGDEGNKVIKKHTDDINSELNLYNEALRDMEYGEVLIDGKPTPITTSNFIKYLASRDRDTRKNVYLTVNGKFKEQEHKFAKILDSIFAHRIKMAEEEKYTSVLEKVLFQENIDPIIVDSLIKAVNKNLSLIQKYLKIKAGTLGIDDAHLYDFTPSFGKDLKIKYSIEEASNIIKGALEPLGSEYLRVVEELLDGHVDALVDEDKHQSITFSWHTYSFMNFRGAYVDLKNMIHELGHIVNYYLSKKNLPFIYEDSTVFVGETASIINEILLNRYLYEHAESEDEKIFYLSKEIENYFTSVFKQTMYTEFENDLYNLKSSTDLTSDVISEKYASIIKKYYGDDIIYDEESYVEWTRLGHLYRWSYYPYKYATGLIIASLIVNSLLDENTLSKEQYIKFLSSGSSMYSLDLLRLLDVDLTNTDIIDNGFKVLEKDIKKLEDSLGSND